MTEVVTRLRVEPVVDEWGVVTHPVDAEPTRLNIKRCLVGSRMSDTGTGRRAASVEVGLAVYILPPLPDLVPTDRLEIRGVVYEIDGDDFDWRDQAGGGSVGGYVPVRRVDG